MPDLAPPAGLTRGQAESVPCPTCGVRIGDECVFVRARASARKGDSMGGSYHSRRADAYHALHDRPAEE